MLAMENPLTSPPDLLLQQAFEGFVFFGGGLVVEGTHQVVFFGLGQGVVFDDFSEDGGAGFGSAAPDDIAAAGGGFGSTDKFQIGGEAGIPREIGSDAEGFDRPAVFAIVLGGEGGPEGIGFR